MSVCARRLCRTVMAAIFIIATTAAVAGDDFPGSKPDGRILKTQEKVDKLFKNGDYDRAYFIYRNDLAPLGDKYAQYMVGYMKLTGKGVEQDYVAGSAWYRLAAERGEENFTRARDDLLERFNAELQAQSDEKYKELRLEYSDAMIVAELIEDDLEVLERAGPTDNTLILAVDLASMELAEQTRVAELAKENLASRLEFLRAALESGEPMSDDELSRIRELEEAVEKALE